MKLLSLEIGELEEGKTFRSLHPGFKVNFHKLTNEGLKSFNEFQPFCFAGLNGSGKSNVLEALSAVFYHLEFCVAKFKPSNFEKHFKREECSLDAFTLKYVICPHSAKDYVYYLSEVVTITKLAGKEPEMFVEPSPLSKSDGKKGRYVSLESSDRSHERAAGKEYLPDLIVAYSSGENEILSLPFIKSRLVHFDEYREAVTKELPFSEPESSLLYIDQEMSQAVLLSCLLLEEEDTLKPLKKELGIVGIQSFRMNLNNQALEIEKDKKGKTTVPILQHINDVLNDLKKCTPFKYANKSVGENDVSITTIDFFIDENTKKIFNNHFKSSFELFRFFQTLYELNSNIIGDDTKEEVYKSKGFYTDGKLPSAAPEDRVFYFLDYKILKKIDGIEKPKELLLREFSDGEHQFLHTMGICLMLKNRRTLLLLDEPETHFNPGWRAKFIKVLNNSIKAGGANNFLKDVILTSHSPFIISDCLPNNVIFFKKHIDTKRVEAKTAKELNIPTFGTSVEIILDELFDYNQSIGDWSNQKLKDIDFNSLKSNEEIDTIKKSLWMLGDSIEKDLVLAKLNKMKK